MAAARLLAITGGTGFVGAKVIQAALDAGYDVRALIRNPDKKLNIQDDRLTWHKGALGDDDVNFVKGADTVIHIAGLIKAKRRTDYDAVNVDAAKALAAAAQGANVGRFVLLSSMAARAPELSDYAGSKHDGELAVKSVFSRPIAIIRAPAVFGSGDEATAPFFVALQRGILPVPGGKGWKDRRLSMVYVEDLAKDIIASGAAGAYDGQTVSPATLPDMTWPEFAALCSEAAEKPIRVIPLPHTLLLGVAGVTSVTSRLFGLGHLTLGKLREFMYQDWSSEQLICGATPPKDALRTTMRYYLSQQKDTL